MPRPPRRLKAKTDAEEKAVAAEKATTEAEQRAETAAEKLRREG